MPLAHQFLTALRAFVADVPRLVVVDRDLAGADALATAVLDGAARDGVAPHEALATMRATATYAAAERCGAAGPGAVDAWLEGWSTGRGLPWKDAAPPTGPGRFP